jgi:hypothetical protein
MSHTDEEILDPSQPALIVTYGHTPRKYRPLQSDLVVLGQGRGCDIGLVSPEIAEAHCILYRTPEGWRLRDCGSRVGTRVNGHQVHESPLRDGDVLQVGNFNFRCQFPDGSAVAEPGARERRLQRSRRHLARLALRLRRRLREQGKGKAGGPDGAGEPQENLEYQVHFLRERLRAYEVRTQALEKSERDVAAEQARLAEEAAALRAGGAEAERDLDRRRSALEAELRRRQEEFEQNCRDRERLHAESLRSSGGSAGGSPEASAAEEARRLDLRRHELAEYANYLLRSRRRLEEQGRSQAGAGDPPADPGELERLRAELAAARRENEEKENQLQQLLTRPQLVDPSPAGMDVESYEAELAQFRRQLQDDRRGLKEEIEQLRVRTLALDEAARAMEAQLAEERARLSQERRELDRLRDEVYQQMTEAQAEGREPRTTGRRFKEPLSDLGASPPGSARPLEKRSSKVRVSRGLPRRRGDSSGGVGR